MAERATWNPLRSEQEAFQFLIGAIAYFAAIRSFRGHYSPEHHHGVEIPGIYWHFVDVMWIVVYVTVYVL